ncbi:MAG: YbjN domain-containing protein [Bacteroidia bacterium]|nr:YbjN domain-containing protein [Bacteroidia bacterium]
MFEQEPDNLTPYYQIVDQAIANLGIDVSESKIGENQWVYIKGSAFTLVEIGTTEMGNHKVNYIQALSPICKIPTKNREGFYFDLLNYNHTLLGTYFAIYDDYILLKMIRDLVGLDTTEVESMIRTVGYASDKLDNPLIKIYRLDKVDVTISLLREMSKVKLLRI